MKNAVGKKEVHFPSFSSSHNQQLNLPDAFYNKHHEADESDESDEFLIYRNGNDIQLWL